MSSSIQSAPVLMSAPASASLSSTASRMLGSARLTRTRPRVIAPATRKVPVSMRSGSTRCSAPPSRSTPSTVMTVLPAPEMRAPMRLRKAARSTTSGSRAAFSITVVPDARVAAIMRFSVPVTVTVSSTMRAPRRRPAVATMLPLRTSTCAPSCCRPCRCRFTGREPMAQPPGSDTTAWPNFATRGPSTRIDARMVLTSSYGASK